TSPWIKALVTSSLVSRAAVQWVSAASARRTRETYSRAVRTSPSRRPGRNSVVTSGWKACAKDTRAHLGGGREWHARYGRDYSEAHSHEHLQVASKGGVNCRTCLERGVCADERQSDALPVAARAGAACASGRQEVQRRRTGDADRGQQPCALGDARG